MRRYVRRARREADVADSPCSCTPRTGLPSAAPSATKDVHRRLPAGAGPAGRRTRRGRMWSGWQRRGRLLAPCGHAHLDRPLAVSSRSGAGNQAVDSSTSARVDTMTVVVQHRMPASTERVWDLLSDVERMAGLGPENVATRWVDPGPAVGARFTGRNLREGREWTVTCLVTVCDRPSAFEWIVGGVAEPSSTWRYDLTDEGAGGTLVTHLFRHGPGFTFLRRAVEKCPRWSMSAYCSGARNCRGAWNRR